MSRKAIYWTVGICVAVMAYLAICYFAFSLLWSGNKETTEAVKNGNEKIAEMNGGIQGVQKSLDGLPKSLGDIIAAGFAAQGEQAGKKAEDGKKAAEDEEKKKPKAEAPATPTAKAPAPKRVPAPIAPTPAKAPVQYHVGQLGNKKAEIADNSMDKVIAEGGTVAAQELIKQLQSPDQPTRLRACYALIGVGEKAVAPLIELWATADNDACHRAKEIVVHIACGGDSVKDQLRVAMKDDRAPVAYWALEAMHTLCKKDVSPAAQPTVPAAKAEPKPRP